MLGLPAILNVNGRRCLIVGGGPVALRRAQALLDAGAEVVVVAPQIDPALSALPVKTFQRGYESDDLDDVFLVVTASDNPLINQAVAERARLKGVLTNRPDAPDLSDIHIPAHRRLGPITITVDTAGTSPSAAAEICENLAHQLDPVWPELIELAARFRPIIQQHITDPQERRRRLRRLADPEAIDTLRRHGKDALIAYYESLAKPDS
ncbi:MAG: hypothetical protein Kow00105_19680 [Phycisphaeraceae bacterium]